MQGVCGSAQCWNVEGSFTCECENREEEFDPLTRQCVNRESAGNTQTHTQLYCTSSRNIVTLFQCCPLLAILEHLLIIIMVKIIKSLLYIAAIKVLYKA